MPDAPRTPVPGPTAQPDSKPRRGRPPGPSKLTHTQRDAIRLAMEHVYVFASAGHTARSLVQLPEFQGVPEPTAVVWIREGGWRQKRIDHFNGLRARLEEHIGEAIVRQRREQLRIYDAIHAQFAAFVLPGPDGRLPAQPRSAESAVAVLLKIDEARSKMRQEITEAIGSRVQAQGTAAPALTDLSDDQARRMAHTLMAATLDAAGDKQS